MQNRAFLDALQLELDHEICAANSFPMPDEHPLAATIPFVHVVKNIWLGNDSVRELLTSNSKTPAKAAADVLREINDLIRSNLALFFDDPDDDSVLQSLPGPVLRMHALPYTIISLNGPSRPGCPDELDKWCPDATSGYREPFEHLNVPVSETPAGYHHFLDEGFARVVEALDTALCYGRSVYMHCNQGEHRSAAALVLYLCLRSSQSFESAHQFVFRRRPFIKPIRQSRDTLMTLAAAAAAQPDDFRARMCMIASPQLSAARHRAVCADPVPHPVPQVLATSVPPPLHSELPAPSREPSLQHREPSLSHREPSLQHHDHSDHRDDNFGHDHCGPPNQGQNQHREPSLQHREPSLQHREPSLQHHDHSDHRDDSFGHDHLGHPNRDDSFGHNQRGHPNQGQNQRSDDSFGHDQRGHPNQGQNQRRDDSFGHDQRGHPNQGQNQRHDDSLDHDQRDLPNQVQKQRGNHRRPRDNEPRGG